MSFRSIIVAVAAIFAFTNAHIIMDSPVPYSVDKIDNSPITASQFPCKSQNGFTVSTMNNMAVGEQQTIKFKGTAVHGGGSCQLSVTMDTEPTENSVFKVIKSIEGGCPGVDGSTNEYNFELPDSIPNGKATFAWTWFSKMSGAPELYMNCAPIEVTGGASDKTAFSALPDMLVANIGEGCTTAQNFATAFPDPGQVVEKGATNDQEAPTGSCGSSSGTTPAVSPSAAQPVASGTATPAQPTTPASSGSSSSSSGSTTCTENGAIMCNGTTQFGLCNNGQIVWQAVAAGTTCSNGVVARRAYNGRVTRPRV
ncbi:lytic polysaccharide monooxygenase, partial [Dothidotthia symphoricarpi CBS 119687]